MNVTLILPAIGKKQGQKYIGTWKMEPLTMAVLYPMLARVAQVAFYDDRIETIPYDQPTDLVLITVETYTARRSYQIAAQYRQRGVRVVLGGYHVTLLPDEAAAHADAILVGNAEDALPALLADLARGQLQPRYLGATGYGGLQPDRAIFAGKKYLPVSLTETGRGCCHHCEFCAIASYYQCRYHRRPIPEIVADIQGAAHRYHFLVDDNLVADRAHAKALFEAIKPLSIKWAGQGTLSMAEDPALLRQMKESGCEIILIGFESLVEDNLRQMNKQVNLLPHQRDELVKRIHDAGIGIYATFVFGYDQDDESTVEAALRFAEKHRFYTAAFNHLLPFPGTPLYERLEAQGRLLYDKWWLEPGYRYGQLAFQPKKLSPQQLSDACLEARRAFSKMNNLLPRGLQAMSHSSPAIWALFWGMNVRIGDEVEEKMNIPIGENLDELPK